MGVLTLDACIWRLRWLESGNPSLADARPSPHGIYRSSRRRGFMNCKIVAAIAFLLASLPADAKDANTRVGYSPIQYLKNFALSTCIADGYKSDDVVKDSTAAAGGYLELGSFPFEAYEQTAALGKTFLAKDYQGKSGE